MGVQMMSLAIHHPSMSLDHSMFSAIEKMICTKVIPVERRRMICPLDRKISLICITVSAVFVLAIGVISGYKHYTFKTECEASGGVFKHSTSMSCIMSSTSEDRQNETDH